MDLKFEVHLHVQDSLNSSTPSSSKIVKLFENGRKVDKENVNEKNEEGNTLLHRVVKNQNVYSPAIVSFLLEEGALVTTGGRQGAFGGGTFRHESIRHETFRIESIRHETFCHFNQQLTAPGGFG